MRPRHKAAEYDHRDCVIEDVPAAASMRPRHKAAEYARAAPATGCSPWCFNEAAA